MKARSQTPTPQATSRERERSAVFGLNNGAVSDVYALGNVGSALQSGGLLGANHGGTLSAGYWDTQTSGQSAGIGSDNNNQGSNAVGLTTAQLQGTLPGGFNGTVWGTGPNLYPYFVWQYPNGVSPSQIVSGTAYNADGSTAGDAAIALYSNGVLLKGGTVASGANGYFYELEPLGTVTTTTKLAETLTLAGQTNVSGVSYTDQPVLTSGNFENFNITAGTIAATTGAPSFSALSSDLAATLGASAYNAMQSQIASPNVAILATNPSGFVLDQSILSGNGGLTLESAGTLTVAAGQTANGSGAINLLTMKNIAVDANLQNAGTGAITLVAGWNGVTQPTASLAAPGVYGNMAAP